MESVEDNKAKKLLKAKKRVETIKGFYIHLTLYFFINIMVSSVIIISGFNGSTFFGGSPFNIGTFASWVLWGIGIFIHAVYVFYVNPIFSKDWEQRKIQKYMEEEKEKTTKYL